MPIIANEDDVTPTVLAAMNQADNPRVREVMASLVKHLHAFAREIKLTEEEWQIGIDFVTGLGKKTTDIHNETILCSDALGLSTMVCLMNNGKSGGTESASALLGPFWRMNSPETKSGDTIVRSPTPGPALFVDAEVKNHKGEPVADAEVDVWHASTEGVYENQDPTQANMNLRGKFHTDKNGRFSFRSVLPSGYPVPIDGPVGQLLKAQNRHRFRPAHLHFLLNKPDYKTLITQIFVKGDQYLDSDVVFGVTPPLVGDYVLHKDGPAPAPDVNGEWYSLDAHFVMEPGSSKLPRPPIK
jgi:catechol 1,2-dioxygenase